MRLSRSASRRSPPVLSGGRSRWGTGALSVIDTYSRSVRLPGLQRFQNINGRIELCFKLKSFNSAKCEKVRQRDLFEPVEPSRGAAMAGFHVELKHHRPPAGHRLAQARDPLGGLPI